MTTGVDIICALLRADSNVTDLVPDVRVKAGALPTDIELPAILVRCVSSAERQSLTRGAFTPTIDRISVAVRAASYREQRAVMKVVKTSCAGKTGTIAESDNVSVLTAGTGPDLLGPGDSFEQTQDFRVFYNA